MLTSIISTIYSTEMHHVDTGAHPLSFDFSKHTFCEKYTLKKQNSIWEVKVASIISNMMDADFTFLNYILFMVIIV